MNDDRFDPISGGDQAAALKKSVSEKAGSQNFNQIAVSGYKVDWKEIGLSPVELGIIESEKWRQAKTHAASSADISLKKWRCISSSSPLRLIASLLS